MKQITCEMIEEKIREKGLYDPRYHYFNGLFWTDEAIEEYNKIYYPCFPNTKRYYHDFYDVIESYIDISLTRDRLANDLDEYQIGEKDLPIGETIIDLCDAFDEYEEVYFKAQENIGCLRTILEEIKEPGVPVEAEAKHFFKNIKILSIAVDSKGKL